MVTIYRRGQVIARCERAEVLAGLRSGRFERQPQRAPTPQPSDDHSPHPLIGLAGLIAAPFVFLRNALDLVLRLAGSLISQAALYLILILLIILVVIACFFFPPIGGILLALGLYLRNRNRD